MVELPVATDRLDADEVASRVAVLVSELGDRVVTEAPLGERTTYRVGGNARAFVMVHSPDEVLQAGAAARTAGLPVLVIGRGSNLLVADRGFDGLAVCLGDEFAEVGEPAAVDGELRIVAGSAVALPRLARRSVALGLAGLEWMVGVPGTVGGGVRMNAGGHGADMTESLVSVTIADVAEDRIVTTAPDALGLRFRGSALQPTDIVLDATFAVRSGDVATGEALLSDIVRWRRDNQPGGQNAGSVFVNPGDGAESAGRLIDEAGLKGLRHRSAQISTKHANFIQADEGGSADDIIDLMRIVADRVHARFGVRLRSEVRLVGYDTAEFQHEVVPDTLSQARSLTTSSDQEPQQ